jgi:hypothetical protein
LFSSYLNKVGQFSFEYCPLSHEISSRIYHLPCFGKLDIARPLLSAFAALPTLVLWEFSTESSALCPTLILQGRFSVPPHLHCRCYIIVCCLCFSALFGGFNLPRCYTWLCSWAVGRAVACGAWCSPVCSADSHKQLWNWTAGKNGTS